MIISDEQQSNPDVNTFNIDPDPGEQPSSGNDEADDPADLIPLPPDAAPPHPVEEPPDDDKTPVGDVDDSPKQIV